MLSICNTDASLHWEEAFSRDHNQVTTQMRPLSSSARYLQPAVLSSQPPLCYSFRHGTGSWPVVCQPSSDPSYDIIKSCVEKMCISII